MKPNQSIIFELVFKLTFIIVCMISVQRSMVKYFECHSLKLHVQCISKIQNIQFFVMLTRFVPCFLLTSGQYSGKSTFFKLIIFLCQFVLSIKQKFLAFVVFTLGLKLEFSFQLFKIKQKHDTSFVYITNNFVSSVTRLKLDDRHSNVGLLSEISYLSIVNISKRPIGPHRSLEQQWVKN